MNKKQQALEYHSRGRHGKIQVTPTKPCLTQRDLSLAYTPGVAVPCLEIEKNPEDAYLYTAKGNLVAVLSNGTAVLGLGNIGALAGKPVMEGKGVLFKRFADVDVFDIEVDTLDPQEIIRVCQLLEPTFGGINLEDIKAPDCFLIEETLKRTMNIPVFHDDQHGTAIISGAALLNAVELAGKDLGRIRIVCNGAGAAGIACANFYVSLGARLENVMMCDTKGVIHQGREDLDPGHPKYNKYKARFAVETTCRTLAEAMKGADVFCGMSVADVVTGEMVRSMAADPIVFAMANPDPEITYPDAVAARADVIMATGRSDYPNQVNNVLGFPFIFRGALDVRSKAINEEMKVAAARALAKLAREDVPDEVCRAYGVEQLRFGREYLIPKPFDPRVLIWETVAVARAACESGVAQKPIEDWDAYRNELESRLGPGHRFMRQLIGKARSMKTKKRIVFSEGDDPKILRAAHQIVEEGIARPVLLGSEAAIRAQVEELGLELLGDVEIVDPLTFPKREEYVEAFFRNRQRKGLIRSEAAKLMANRRYFAPMMVLAGDADAMVGGMTGHYPETIRPALQVIKEPMGVHLVSGSYVMIFENRLLLFSDTTVNIEPNAEQLAELAEIAAEVAHSLDIEPRVALLSFSNFGSAPHPASEKMSKAREILAQRRPDLLADGEMQADTAVDSAIATDFFPFSRIKGNATVLLFPDLASGNIAYKLLRNLGGAHTVGPILAGMKLSIHVLQKGCEVEEVVSIAALAAIDAEAHPREARK
jgi:malate dehydrogenase (oxaloacetate-decarboxylating)(NADP+)